MQTKHRQSPMPTNVSPAARRSLPVVILLSVLLAGCGSLPKTADTLRKNARGGAMFSEKDTVDVKRPVSQIADTFRKKAPECLQKKVAASWDQGGLRRRQVRAFKPTLKVGKDRVELALQSLIVEGGTDVGAPPDGWFIVVVDAYALDKQTTRVELYKHAPGYSAVLPAIKNWATGQNMGCPDFTQ